MEVSLTETDVVILRYDVPMVGDNGERKMSGSELVLIVDDMGVYTSLFKAGGTNAYMMNWRGSLDVCLTKFQDEVDVFESDFVTEQREHMHNRLTSK